MSKTTSLTDYFYMHFADSKIIRSSFIQNLSTYMVQNLSSELCKYFTNIEQFLPAITHRSFVHEFSMLSSTSYERLEFLGDAFLQLYITRQIFALLPTTSEGNMSKLRASLVNEKMLASLARTIGIEKLALVGKGEFKKGEQFSDAIVSDLFESLIGSIDFYQSSGKAEDFLDLVIEKYELATGEKFYDLNRLNNFDYKSQLQIFFLSEFSTLPEYKYNLSSDGVICSLYLNQKEILSVSEVSKKKASTLVAKKFLDNKNTYLLNKEL